MRNRISARRPRAGYGRRLAAALAVAGACAVCAQEDTDWPAYHGGYDNGHHSHLDQVHRGNVADLEIAWTLDTGDLFPGREMYAQPLVIDGVIYVVSPKLKVIAADAAGGEIIWQFDPFEGHRALGRYRVRGLTHWSAGEDARLFVGIRHHLYALNARTGRPVPGFGEQGRIDLREHLDRNPEALSVQLTTPGVVFGDLLIVGSAVSEFLPSAYGDIRAFDVRSGELRWTFHTIPRPGEFGHETWPAEAWRHTGGANSWAGLALDAVRGIVFAPTGSTAFDYYGGDRSGDNLFANSLLALDAATGERIWHYQTVRHDTWDRDLPTAPTLVTVQRAGRRIDAVAQPTKSGHLFLFDRETGETLFPIEELPVPAAEMPGEMLSPTQPLPLLPAPFARQRLTEAMLSRRTPDAHAAVQERFRQYRSGGQFTPLGTTGTIMQPGLDGGAEWGGAAWDPDTGLLYLNANDVPWLIRLSERPPSDAVLDGREIYDRDCAVCHGAERRGTADLPPLTGLEEFHSLLEVVQFVALGSGTMPGFRGLGADALYAVSEYVLTGRETAAAANNRLGSVGQPAIETRSSGGAEAGGGEHPAVEAEPDRRGPVDEPIVSPYILAEASRFQDPDGYPAIEPPWGTLNAINLDTGDYVWRVPLGEYPELADSGAGPTGSENYGGPLVTAGGLVFMAATVFDRKFRAFDKATGELLWETVLPAAGHATPITYRIDGRQYVVIAAGGGKATTRSGIDDAGSGAKYVAFALPQTRPDFTSEQASADLERAE